MQVTRLRIDLPLVYSETQFARASDVARQTGQPENARLRICENDAGRGLRNGKSINRGYGPTLAFRTTGAGGTAAVARLQRQVNS